MPWRVGITTKPAKRRGQWEGQVVGLSGWRILKTCNTKAEAQTYETDCASKYSCQAQANGAEASGSWYVYQFDYTRTK